ncbi:MAG: hypothetical protein GEU98_12445 [Pseudonocardiaceae bacterium]|nr:hypothetical protein [Pseudonocardiaceae bacterium]
MFTAVRPPHGLLSSLVLDELLVELRQRHWTLVRWGEAKAPTLLAAILRWNTCSDVLILRSENDATAFRAPAWPDSNVFSPRKVSYQYHANALWTLRAILSLPAPGSAEAPRLIETPHAKCSIPDDLPSPVLIRPLARFPCGR